MKLQSIICAAVSILTMLSCTKPEVTDLTPKQFIECEEIGVGDSHPNNTDFQGILNKYVSKGFPGLSAAVYTQEGGLWTGSAGLSNIDSKTAASPCNLFYSGSVAKMYTVTAAMVLYEQEKVDLEAKIADYLPEEIKNNLPNAAKVTIKQLMNHSSGIPDHDYDDELNEYLDRNDAKLPSPSIILGYLFDDKPVFEPGTKAEYSSANTVTLAMVLDSIVQGKHEDIITEHIITKLGLTDTYYRNEYKNGIPDKLVSGYYGKASNNREVSMESVNYCTSSYGDAGIMATAHDYFLFLKALMKGTIVSHETLDEMYTGIEVFSQEDFSLEFGLGMFNFKQNGETIKIGHGGFTVGGMSNVWYYPTINAYVVLTTNTSDEDNENFMKDWGQILVDFEELL